MGSSVSSESPKKRKNEKVKVKVNKTKKNNEKKIKNNRISSYYSIEKLLKEEDQVEKCGLEPFDYSQIGSPSVSGIAMKLTLKEDPSYTLVAKVLEYKNRSIREASYYDLFKDDVLNGNTPHFPLVWEGLNCKDKCRFINPKKIGRYLEDSDDIQKWKEIKDRKCFMIFVELFKGDGASYCRKYRDDKSRLASVVSQVMMGMYTLRKNGLAHDDMHLKNILYTDVDKGNNVKSQYFKYVIKEKDTTETYYIKHFDTLFVLWDFERMKKEGKESSYANEEALSAYGVDDISEDELIASIYWDFTMFLSAMEYYKKHSFLTDLIESYKTYTVRYYDNKVKHRNKYKDYSVIELLNKLCEIDEFKDVLIRDRDNKNKIDTKVTTTFYP
jgi:hypothetical protein